MTHEIGFLHDLAIVMLVSGITTIIFHKLKQPVVLGYMLAGFIIGPHTPPFPLIQSEATIKVLAAMGVVFIMFRMGLHFHLRKIAQVGMTALVAGAFEIAAMILIGYKVGQIFGWNAMDSLFLGAILSISSTTIIVRTLVDQKLLNERFVQLIMAILVVEDILAIAILALLSSFASTGSFSFGQLGFIALKLSAFIASLLVIGLLLVPRVLKYVGRFRDNEMLLVVTLSLLFGVSLLAVYFGYSVALGAFIIGAIMAESREAGAIEKVIAPLRDMFSAVFFVAVGMLINPQLLIEHAVPILILTAVVIVGKIVACSSGAFLVGNDPRTSVRVGIGLAQIGEFSFIIAQLGMTLGVTSDFIYPITVMISVITAGTTPYLIRNSDYLLGAISRQVPRAVVKAGHTYLRIIGQLRHNMAANNGSERLHPAIGWLLLNLLLISAILIIAAGSAKPLEIYLSAVPAWFGGANGAIWFIAITLIMPFILASIRKIVIIADVLGERAIVGNNRPHIKKLLTQLFFFLGCVLLFIWSLLLSATILPSSRVLFLLVLVLLMIAAIWHRKFTAVYSTGQELLRETFTKSKLPRKTAKAKQLLPSLPEIQLIHIEIPTDSAISGKLIRELHLRSETGAVIVGILRGEEQIINPSADEELRTGDKLVIVGKQDSLAAARTALA